MFSSKKISGKPNYGDWLQIGEDIEGLITEDKFGYSIDLSKDGSTIVVGSPQENNGYVKVFKWNGSEWVQIGRTIVGDNDGTGWSVGTNYSGDTIAVGSPFFNSSNGVYSGKVSIYKLESDWRMKGEEIIGDFASDQAGYSLDLSDDGDFIYIGSIYNDISGRNSGQVRSYDWNGSSWVEDLEIRGKSPGDLAGFSVSGNGNTIAFASIFNDDSGTNSGKVSIYEWSDGLWSLKGNEINGESAGDQSGFSLNMSEDGNTIVIGAPFNDGNGPNSGHARVYSWDGQSWNQKGEDIDGEYEGDGSGHSVSISDDGNIIAIGAIYNDDGGFNAGHVRLHFWEGTKWIQLGSDIDGKNIVDQSGSGRSVSVNSNGKIVAIGSPYSDKNGLNSGSLRVFQYSYSYF
jgi:hypothetical protein